MNLIATILERIAANNFPQYEEDRPFASGLYAGRREAYEDVLRMLGYYSDQDEVRVYGPAGEDAGVVVASSYS